MVISRNTGPQYESQNSSFLVIGPPNQVPLILGNPHATRPKIRADAETRVMFGFGSFVMKAAQMTRTWPSEPRTKMNLRCGVLILG